MYDKFDIGKVVCRAKNCLKINYENERKCFEKKQNKKSENRKVGTVLQLADSGRIHTLHLPKRPCPAREPEQLNFFGGPWGLQRKK